MSLLLQLVGLVEVVIASIRSRSDIEPSWPSFRVSVESVAVFDEVFGTWAARVNHQSVYGSSLGARSKRLPNCSGLLRYCRGWSSWIRIDVEDFESHGQYGQYGQYVRTS